MLQKIVKDFINREIYDFQEEASLCLDYCDEENDYHLTSYWINGTYENVKEFLKLNYSNEIKKEILSLYPYDLEKLNKKITKKYKLIDDKIISLEALGTILLKEFQKLTEWYTVYGCEEEDLIDFYKYNINYALVNEEEFPIIKLSDITAAMYGINDTVTCSDLYDVFAHYSDILKNKEISEENKQATLIEEKSKDTFTPDIFIVAAVVARYKNYKDYENKMISDYAVDFFRISNLPESIKNINILNYVIQDYYNRFKNPPSGLPLNDDAITGSIILENNIEKFKLNFNISGIRNFKNEKETLFSEIYDIPQNSKELQDLIIKISVDFKRELLGLEKVRNKDIPAVIGKYPNKYSSTHGLTFIKDANVECKDKKRNKEYKKEPKTKFNLALAEKQSLYIIKKSLRKAPENPFISCSFGIDSITTLHLLRRVTNNFKIIFNNSLIEYPDLIQFKNKIIKEWDLKDKIIETKPKETYWELLEKNGWNFNRKGHRDKDKNKKQKESSEICCMKIKHEPTYDIIDKFIKEKNPISIDFTGLRACEAKSREQSGKRDNVVYYSKTWKCIKANPILFFTENMVWDYVRKYNIPYCKIYDKTLYYEDIYNDLSEDEYGKVYYQPRVGCWACMLNNERGYLMWLKNFMPAQYKFLMYNKKLALELYIRGMKKQGFDISNDPLLAGRKNSRCDSQISFFNDLKEDLNDVKLKEDFPTDINLNQEDLERLEMLITSRPCKFL